MSAWTHVAGCLYVDTCVEEKDIEKYVLKLLENAPKVTGSERDCDIFVNSLSGHNSSTNMDCGHCEYKDTVKHLDGGGFICDADDDYKCPEAEYQSCVAITIVGDLRDKTIYETTKEIDDFIRYIQNIGNGFTVDYASIIVADGWNGDYTLKIKYNRDDWDDKGELIWYKVWEGEDKDV